MSLSIYRGNDDRNDDWIVIVPNISTTCKDLRIRLEDNNTAAVIHVRMLDEPQEKKKLYDTQPCLWIGSPAFPVTEPSSQGLTENILCTQLFIAIGAAKTQYPVLKALLRRLMSNARQRQLLLEAREVLQAASKQWLASLAVPGMDTVVQRKVVFVDYSNQDRSAEQNTEQVLIVKRREQIPDNLSNYVLVHINPPPASNDMKAGELVLRFSGASTVAQWKDELTNKWSASGSLAQLTDPAKALAFLKGEGQKIQTEYLEQMVMQQMA